MSGTDTVAACDPVDVCDEFRRAMFDAGMVVLEQIIADDKLHRVNVAGDERGRKNGWYVVHTDGVPAGAFGSWKLGVWQTWSAKGTQEFTVTERAAFKAKLDAARNRRAAEQQAAFNKAAARAQKIWDEAHAVENHPYLERKGVESHGLCVRHWSRMVGDHQVTIPNALIVPLRNAKGEIRSLQAIFPDKDNPLGRDKDFLSGGQKSGLWHAIGLADASRPPVIALAEGYATAASIHKCTGLPVVVTFDSGNLLLVGREIRRLFPQAKLVYCGDDDRWTKGNPGKTKALEAVEKTGGISVLPEFASLVDKPTDFNDLYVCEGVEVVCAQIDAAINPAPDQSVSETPDAGAIFAKAEIRIRRGELPEQVDEDETALLKAEIPIFQRGNLIVRPMMMPVAISGGRKVLVQRLATVKNHNLAELMMRAATFVRFDSKSCEWVPADIPMRVVETYLQREDWRLRVLTGIISAPTLRPDGSILQRPGYDADTGLLFDPQGAVFPTIPEYPSVEDAEAALKCLREVIATFPFVGDSDRTVALSAILTALMRRSLPSAPMHTFTAPVAGSGKSKLVDIVSVIATAHEAPVTSQGADEEEMEKRIGASMLAGDQIISLDNCEQPLGGVFLCQALTQTAVAVRILGKSVMARLPSNAAFFATGNNLVIVGDLTRRAVNCALDPGEERPELRRFSFDPVELAKARRGELAIAGLTVLRAFHIAGRPKQRDPLGSFSEWSRTVRDALIWLGEADPCDTMEHVRKSDPKLAALTAIIKHWAIVIYKASVSTRGIIEIASKQSPRETGGSEFDYPDFREALLLVAGRGGVVNSRSLGHWIGANQGRIVDGMKIVPDTVLNGTARWKLVDAKTAASAIAG